MKRGREYNLRGNPKSMNSDRKRRRFSSSFPSKQIVGKVQNLTIFNEDLECLKPGEWLTDTIIDYAIMTNSGERSNKAVCFNSHFFPLLEKDVCRVARNSKLLKHESLFDKDVIMIPYNAGSHWTLFVVCNLSHCWNQPIRMRGYNRKKLLSVVRKGKKKKKKKKKKKRKKKRKKKNGAMSNFIVDDIIVCSSSSSSSSSSEEEESEEEVTYTYQRKHVSSRTNNTRSFVRNKDDGGIEVIEVVEEEEEDEGLNLNTLLRNGQNQKSAVPKMENFKFPSGRTEEVLFRKPLRSSSSISSGGNKFYENSDSILRNAVSGGGRREELDWEKRKKVIDQMIIPQKEEEEEEEEEEIGPKGEDLEIEKKKSERMVGEREEGVVKKEEVIEIDEDEELIEVIKEMGKKKIVERKKVFDTRKDFIVRKYKKSEFSCITYCDSLGGESIFLGDLNKKIREYLQLRFKFELTQPQFRKKLLENFGEDFTFSSENMPSQKAKLPTQKNSFDCGVFLIEYIRYFWNVFAKLEKKRFPIHKRRIFGKARIENTRTTLLKELMEICTEYKENEKEESNGGIIGSHPDISCSNKNDLNLTTEEQLMVFGDSRKSDFVQEQKVLLSSFVGGNDSTSVSSRLASSKNSLGETKNSSSITEVYNKDNSEETKKVGSEKKENDVIEVNSDDEESDDDVIIPENQPNSRTYYNRFLLSGLAHDDAAFQMDPMDKDYYPHEENDDEDYEMEKMVSMNKNKIEEKDLDGEDDEVVELAKEDIS